jgi:hypothetical protein
VSRNDDLEELERDVGPSVRVALRRAAATVADDAPGHDLRRADVPVIDLDPVSQARSGPARWRFATAAVAALVLVVGGVLVWVATNDDAATPAPAGPGPTSTTTSPSPRGEALLPPEGTPSTPVTGELVASIAFWGPNIVNAPGWADTSLNLFADGRLIRLPTLGVPGEMGEQRLTPEGVERVRAEILATVFGGGQQPVDPGSCACIIRVRDGGRLLSTPTGLPGSNPVDPRVDRLIEYLTTLESSLPGSAWEQRDAKAFVPLRYLVCVYGEGGGTNDQPISDIPGVLARQLPAPVAQLLAGANPCAELTTADARTLARRLSDAGVEPYPWSPRLHYSTPWSSEQDPGSVAIDLSPLLPDGKAASWDAGG